MVVEVKKKKEKYLDKARKIVRGIISDIARGDKETILEFSEGDWSYSWYYEWFGIDEVKLFDDFGEIFWNSAIEIANERGMKSVYYWLDKMLEDIEYEQGPYEALKGLDYKRLVVWFVFNHIVGEIREEMHEWLEKKRKRKRVEK